MKAMKRSILAATACFILVISVSFFSEASGGRVVLAVSDSSVAVGDTVTVTATAYNSGGSRVSATLKFSFDSSKFSFVSCDASGANASGGTVTAKGSQAAVKLRAENKGSSVVTASATASGGSLTAAGVNIAVSGEGSEADGTKSADNSLKSLKLSEGTLSPEFKYSQTKYTATVAAETTKVEVSGKTSNEEAKITSITGNEDLKMGKNTIKIVVTAENGSEAVYQVVVTRDEAVTAPEEDGNETPDNEDKIALKAGEFTIDGTVYAISDEFDISQLPAGFEMTEVIIDQEAFSAVQYDQSGMYLLYLAAKKDEKDAGFYAYDPQKQMVCPYVGIGLKTEDSQLTDDEQLTYLQKNYDKLYEKYQRLVKKNRITFFVSLIVIVILAIIIINFIVFGGNRPGRKGYEEKDEEDELEEEHFHDNIKKAVKTDKFKSQEEYLTAFAKNSDISENQKAVNEVKKPRDAQEEDIEIIDLDDL